MTRFWTDFTSSVSGLLIFRGVADLRISGISAKSREIPKKKRLPTLVILTQNWSILAKFAKKNPAKSAVFYWLFLGEVFPRNFPWNRRIFLRICPRKSFENWLFSAKVPRNWPIFHEFAPENPAKFCFFFREISEALQYGIKTQLDHVESLILIVHLRNGSQKLVVVSSGLQENLYPFLIG